MDIRYIFVVIYLVVDILYVYGSIPVYQKVVKAIQGKTTNQPFGLVAGVLAYAIMGVAWLFFAPHTILYLQKTYSISRVAAGAITGFMLGLTIYGVFNFTNHAMFDNWSWPIIARDLAWGTSWLTALTTLYAYFSS